MFLYITKTKARDTKFQIISLILKTTEELVTLRDSEVLKSVRKKICCVRIV